ncbi:histone deacetylase complex subunit SAP18 [Acrasis kona]|uniref:Histone deacetylase complex subunit SAP18 n=1 Tax=Acrasis kona TaxID=1008807 RepID=A0AAW2Z7S5_9EUKA
MSYNRRGSRGDRDRDDRGDRRDHRDTRNRDPPATHKPLEQLDRTKTCPFMLRLFWKTDGNHSLELFDNQSKLPTDEMLTIYTWKDATLSELFELIQQQVPEANEDGVTIEFRVIFINFNQGKALSRPLGKVTNKRKTEDDNKTLQSLRFEVGDFIDVSIIRNN